MPRRTATPLVLTLAAIVGAAGGWWLARRHDRSQREALFAPRAYQRFAALGWIAAHGDSSHVPVLLDYLAWEPEVALRERAQRIIARFRSAAA